MTRPTLAASATAAAMLALAACSAPQPQSDTNRWSAAIERQTEHAHPPHSALLGIWCGDAPVAVRQHEDEFNGCAYITRIETERQP